MLGVRLPFDHRPLPGPDGVDGVHHHSPERVVPVDAGTVDGAEPQGDVRASTGVRVGLQVCLHRQLAGAVHRQATTLGDLVLAVPEDPGLCEGAVHAVRRPVDDAADVVLGRQLDEVVGGGHVDLEGRPRVGRGRRRAKSRQVHDAVGLRHDWSQRVSVSKVEDVELHPGDRREPRRPGGLLRIGGQDAVALPCQHLDQNRADEARGACHQDGFTLRHDRASSAGRGDLYGLRSPQPLCSRCM